MLFRASTGGLVLSKLDGKALSTILNLGSPLSTMLTGKLSRYSKLIRDIQSELLLRSSAFQQARCSDIYLSFYAFRRVTVIECHIC
jgi:hypothetical protein